ncbi:hypothetical protein C5E45_31245 [Nocardia nova]|uniref:N-acetyltransferase domain-containing protein n=2 Tax=Nocardia nova TaxID=37330 RepID=A0A2S6AGH2_9NOCA|nr:hypothetical protein C5E45_31245 [Nocardia nova]
MLGDMPSLAGIVSATTRFANRRGVYAGRRATKVQRSSGIRCPMTMIRTGRDLAADTRVHSLLSVAVGDAQTRLDAVLRRYRDDPATGLLVVFLADEPIGVAGYERCADRIVLLHIATSPRGRGVGRRLVARIRADDPALPIVAETDRSALGFYAALGFTATALGEKYPGVERFRVCLPAGDDSN